MKNKDITSPSIQITQFKKSNIDITSEVSWTPPTTYSSQGVFTHRWLLFQMLFSFPLAFNKQLKDIYI